MAVAATAADAPRFLPGEWSGTRTLAASGAQPVRIERVTVGVVAGDGGYTVTLRTAGGETIQSRLRFDEASRTFAFDEAGTDAGVPDARVPQFLAHGRGSLAGSVRDPADPEVTVRESLDVGATALVWQTQTRRGDAPLRDVETVRLTRRVPAAALLSDAEVLHRTYLALHPGLYRYLDAAGELAAYDALRARLATATSLGDAFADFTRYTAAIRCGHSYPNFYNQPHALAEALFGDADKLPFRFVWLDGRMIVTQGGATLPPGTEVRAIDGTPVNAILAALMPFARADGSNDRKRVADLELTGADRYEAFDEYYPLAFPNSSGHFDLRVVRPDAASESDVTVEAQSDAGREAAYRANGAGAPEDALWHERDLAPHVAYVKMPTWALYDSKRDWKAELQAMFERIVAANDGALVIDLRGNEGGLDVGDEIAAHLIGAPVTYDPMRRFVRYRRVPDELESNLDTWDDSFRDWGSAAVPFDARFFRLTKYDDGPQGTTIEPKAPRFRGRVWVLVDASNSSATFQFDALVRRERLGSLAGPATGGNLRGINGGAFFFLRLPNSGIEVDVPLIGTFPVTPQPDAALVPDLVVAPTPASIAAGSDVVLDAVLKAAAAP